MFNFVSSTEQRLPVFPSCALCPHTVQRSSARLPKYPQNPAPNTHEVAVRVTCGSASVFWTGETLADPRNPNKGPLNRSKLPSVLVLLAGYGLPCLSQREKKKLARCNYHDFVCWGAVSSGNLPLGRFAMRLICLLAWGMKGRAVSARARTVELFRANPATEQKQVMLNCAPDFGYISLAGSIVLQLDWEIHVLSSTLFTTLNCRRPINQASSLCFSLKQYSSFSPYASKGRINRWLQCALRATEKCSSK